MKHLFLICSIVISFLAQSQRLPFNDDYFGVLNPASHFNQNSHVNLLSYSGLQKDLLNIGSIAQYKHNFKHLTLGVIGNGNYHSYFQNYSFGTQVGYKYEVRRKFVLTSAIGTRFSSNNYNFSTVPGNWNPLVLGLDAGFTLESRKLVFGVHLRDFNQANYRIGSTQFKKNMFVGFYASYRFKLDSLGKYELRPAVFFEQSIDNQQRMMNLDLRFKFNNHAVTLGTGLGANNLVLGYN